MKPQAAGSPPLVSVVIPFYNDPYIREAVDSALAQTYRPLEIVLVDDGSSRFGELLDPYRSDGRIRISRQENRGTAAALNAGFRLAAGKYKAWLSSDDRFRPDKVEKQARFMEESGYAISHTAFRRMDADGTVEKQPVSLGEISLTRFYRSMLLSNTVNGCTVMMSDPLFSRMGGFNERLPYVHDYELWLRILLSGFPIGYLNEPLTDYRVHDAMGSVRHRPEIGKELESVRQAYIPKLQRLIGMLESGGMNGRQGT